MANNSNQQRMIDCMFQKVYKEQRLVVVTQELELLSKEIKMQNQEKEQVASATLKRPIGRPQKQLQATLMAKKEIKQGETRSTYTNWFAPHLWPSIFASVKKHGDLTTAFHYLKTFHRKPREVNGPYEKLSRGSLYEWFTLRKKLKPHLKKTIARGTTPIPTHFSILETRPKLKDESINVLKSMRAVG
jgi:hypothetical protein